MAVFSQLTAGDISSIDDLQKVRDYLYKLNKNLRYMFNNLTPEDNYSEMARLTMVTDGQRQASIEASLEGIVMSYVSKDNIVSTINLSEEMVQIAAEKIRLEGVVTVNGYFKVGLDGSIEATNGKFSGAISGSNISLGGSGGGDGYIVVYNSSGTEIGRWDKNGINVKAGSINGASLTLGGSNNASGTITVKNASGTTIGTWTKDGINVRSGSINGASIVVGGNNNVSGTITVKNASGATIGTWNKDGISVTSGSITGGTINGANIVVGGNNNASGTITVKNASGATVGTWNKDGLSVTSGSITGGSISGATISGGTITGTHVYGSYIGSTSDDFYVVEDGNSVEVGVPGFWFGDDKMNSNWIGSIENPALSTDSAGINGNNGRAGFREVYILDSWFSGGTGPRESGTHLWGVTETLIWLADRLDTIEGECWQHSSGGGGGGGGCSCDNDTAFDYEDGPINGDGSCGPESAECPFDGCTPEGCGYY